MDLEPFWFSFSRLGASWKRLGRAWMRLGRAWRRLGIILERLGAAGGCPEMSWADGLAAGMVAWTDGLAAEGSPGGPALLRVNPAGRIGRRISLWMCFGELFQAYAPRLQPLKFHLCFLVTLDQLMF